MMKPALAALVLLASTALAPAQTTQPAATADVVVRVDQPKPISRDLFGVFFEDLNYAADGGLYAELVQNRAFDYTALDRGGWHPLTAWELVERDGGRGALNVSATTPAHPDNSPNYAVLEVGDAGRAGVGVANAGFGGIAVKAGEAYDLALHARTLYTGGRWGNQPAPADAKLTARLEAKDGSVLAEHAFELPSGAWQKLTATLTPSATVGDARLVLLVNARGGFAFDHVSLFPRATFKSRPNGLRADLAQTIADLEPRFVRFPGGCLAHGDGLGNMYRWKDTVGPVERRRGQRNVWGYRQSVGLGYFEYFQFCADLGALPLPVVAAGVSCQNGDHKAGTGQQCVPMERMGAYVQDVLDLVEYANGPADSTWGRVRAEAGHPEPFNLKYLGVGNEDVISPEFEARFKMIREAVNAKHPDIIVIGTSGPFHSGRDFDEGWRVAREQKVALVDEHYYEQPRWFLDNTRRYDGYDRAGSKVYVGEYASRGNALHNALAEAAYMTGLERNGDVVTFASYAPLLAKRGHIHWHPDLIYFDNERVLPSVNYEVQKLFGAHAGDTYFPTEAGGGLFASTVRDGQGDLVVKLVNAGDDPVRVAVKLEGIGAVDDEAIALVLTGDPQAINPGDPRARAEHVAQPPMVPVEKRVRVGPSFEYEVPAHSLTVLRLRTS